MAIKITVGKQVEFHQYLIYARDADDDEYDLVVVARSAKEAYGLWLEWARDMAHDMDLTGISDDTLTAMISTFWRITGIKVEGPARVLGWSGGEMQVVVGTEYM